LGPPLVKRFEEHGQMGSKRDSKHKCLVESQSLCKIRNAFVNRASALKKSSKVVYIQRWKRPWSATRHIFVE
jgi:hypothetical protein